MSESSAVHPLKARFRGYFPVVIDVETERSEEALAMLKAIDSTLRARILL